MKESLIGLSTIAILFGLVWLSQGDIYTTKDYVEEYENYEKKEVENLKDTYIEPVEEENKDSHIVEKVIDPCDVCKNINDAEINANYDQSYTNMYDNFTFTEAFKLCRQCQGNDGIFYWKDNLYLTKIKQKETNIVEKELTESKTPPTKTHEAVNSK